MKASKNPKKTAAPTTAKSKSPGPAAARKGAGRTTARTPRSSMAARRADLGAPIDGFFVRQPAHVRPIDLPRSAVRGWLRISVQVARKRTGRS